MVFNMKSRLLAARKRNNKNHVFFNYVENEKVFVINTKNAMMRLNACARGDSHKLSMESGTRTIQLFSDLAPTS